MLVHDLGPSNAEFYGQILLATENLTWGAGTIAVSAGTTPVKVLLASSNFAATIGAPSGSPPAVRSQDMRSIIKNQSGGFTSTPIKFATCAGGFVAQGPVSPANGTYVIVDFAYYQPDGLWVECNRTKVPTVFISDGTLVDSGSGSPATLKTMTI